MPTIVTKFLLKDNVRVLPSYAEHDEDFSGGEEGFVTQINFSIYEPTLYEVQFAPGATEWFTENFLDKSYE